MNTYYCSFETRSTNVVMMLRAMTLIEATKLLEKYNQVADEKPTMVPNIIIFCSDMLPPHGAGITTFRFWKPSA